MIEFQDYGFEDNARYLEYLRRCIQIPSLASPLYLLAAREHNKIRRGYAAELCWQKYVIGGREVWYVPLGDWDEINWQKVFAEHVPENTRFYFVPEYLVKLWQKQLGATIEVDGNRDDWDYILYLDRLKNLEGSKLRNFRNERNVFDKTYNHTVEDITPKIFDELRTFQASAEEDLQARVEHLQDAQEENEKFLFALNHWDELKNLFGFVVRVDGQIVAHRIDEQIDETHSIGLFTKSNYDFKGINQFSFWCNAKKNLERGIVTQNIMDDVGEKNLRFFKEHLYPLVMLKKFKVTYKPSGAAQLPTIQTREEHGLKLSFERLNKDLTIALSGKLDTDAANWARNNILSALDGVDKLTFDLDGLEYISSSGLRILVAAMKKIHDQSGTMTVKNVGEQVKEVFVMTGFAQIFNVEA